MSRWILSIGVYAWLTLVDTFFGKPAAYAFGIGTLVMCAVTVWYDNRRDRRR